MGKVKIVLNRAGVRELLRSDEMKAACEECAAAICARCGNGYETDSLTGPHRAVAKVWPETAAARRENRANDTLTRALK